MTDYLIPGPAKAVLNEALGLDPEAGVAEMLAEIRRLKDAEVESARSLEWLDPELDEIEAIPSFPEDVEEIG